MDKQTLKKHHFWILLGLAVILIPVVLSGAVFGVGSRAAEEKGKIETKLKALTSQQVKGKDYREKLDEQKVELQKQKTRVWRDAYAAQAGLIRWPNTLNHLNDLMVTPNFETPAKLYFGDPIDDRDRAQFRTADVYLAEYNRLPEVIAPTEFVDKSWQKVLRYWEWVKVPSTEEVWLALEDLCVQREVLRDIHAVNQMVAEFLPDPLPPKKPAELKAATQGEQARYQEEMKKYGEQMAQYNAEKQRVDKEVAESIKPQTGETAGRFISPYWRLDLAVSRPPNARGGELKFRGKLTNISGRRQNVARIEFKVWLIDPAKRPDAQYAVLPVQEEYLGATQSVEFDAIRPAPNDGGTRVYKIEQKLDTRYVPVKRVDQLRLDVPSHRFASKPLAATLFSDEEIKKAPPPPAADTSGGGPPLAAGGAGAAASADFTPNGIPRKRYIERTEQVRRMPVAVVLVVDQAHIQDVLRALSNSRLRFQNTQVHYDRFRGTISLGNPEMVAGGGPGDAAGGPVAGRPDVPRPGGDRGERGGGAGSRRGPDRGAEDLGPGFRGGPGGPIPPRPPFPGGPPMAPGFAPTVDEEASNNLVELTVYGLVSLYEQFPPKASAGQPATDAGGQPAQPAAPPPPAAPPGAPVPPPPGAPVPPPATPPTGGNLPPPTNPTPPPQN